MITAQSLFDEAITYLRTMPRQAAAPNGVCMYRSDNGPCLVGRLLTDEEATYRVEGFGVLNLFTLNLLPERLHPYRNLLNRLQILHDNKFNWGPKGFINHAAIVEIANDFNLTVPA